MKVKSNEINVEIEKEIKVEIEKKVFVQVDGGRVILTIEVYP